MNKSTILIVVAFLLALASLGAAYMYRTSRSELLAQVQHNAEQLETAQQQLKAASEKNAENEKALLATTEKMQNMSKELQTANQFIEEQKEKNRVHIARCELKTIAKTLAKVKNLSERNPGRYELTDILNFIAHGTPAQGEDGARKDIVYQGSCFIPPGTVTKINEIPIENADDIAKSMKSAEEIVIQVETPQENG
ncbi:MAG: hypothetical protein ABIJ09_01640 [Pseudomonadota bacterium]